MNTPIARAIELLGGYEATGRVCGVSGKAVMKWYNRKRLPRTEYTGETHYAELIENATNGAVTARELRPDIAAIFGSAESAEKPDYKAGSVERGEAA